MMTMRDLEKRRKKNVTTKTTTDSKNTTADKKETVSTTTKTEPIAKDYSSAVKYLESKGVSGASGIMTENEFRRRKKSSGYSTYQDYLNGMISRYGAGNINLNKQPLTTNEEGTRSTIDSASYFDERDKKHVLIPIDIKVDGEWKRVSGDEAWQHYLKTGEHLGKFDTSDEANAYATNLYVDHKDYYKSVQKHDDAYWDKRYQEELERARKKGAFNPTTQALTIVDEERSRENSLYAQAQYGLKGIELAEKIRNDPKFEEYVAAGEAMANEKDGFHRKNPVAYLRNNPDMMGKYENAVQAVEDGANVVSSIYKEVKGNEYKLAKYGTQGQLENYYAYLGKGDKKGAEEYLKGIEQSLNNKMGMAIAAEKDTMFEKFAFAAEAGPDNFIQGMKSKFNFSDDYIPISHTQVASGQVRESLKDVGPKFLGSSLGQGVYDFITTTTNMAPSILASVVSNAIAPGSGAFVGAGLMGASASGNAYQEKLNAGWNKGQARFYSAAVGVSEAGLQYLLGGIGSLGGTITKTNLEAIAKGINNAALRFAVRYGGNIVSEGIEESLQEVLTPFFENLALGYAKNGWSDIDWEQVAYSGALGALSAGFLEGGPTAVNTVSEVRNEKNIGKVYAPNVDDLIQSGLESDPESEAYKIAEKMQDKKYAGKSINNAELGRAVQAIEEEIRNESAQPDSLEQAAKDVVANNERKVNAAREAGSKGVPRTLLNLTTAEEVKAYNEGRQAANKTNRTSAPSYEALEALTQNNEPITAADVKKVTVFGDKGAELVANLANKEGATLSQAERTVKTAYMAGFANVESNQVSFVTDTQIDAFTAGKQDRLMQDTAAQNKANNATVYKGTFTENEYTKNFTKEEKTMISTVAKSFGMDVSAVDKVIASVVNGRTYEANAEHQDGKMRISSTAEKVISELVLHEGGHRMRQLAPAEFGVLMDALYKRAEGRNIKLGVSQNLHIDSIKSEHDKAGITMDTSGYMEEFAVRELETIFASAEEFNKWYAEISGNQEVKTAWQKFMDFITEIIEKVKAAIAQSKMTKEERAEAKKNLAELERIKELYANAYKAAEKAVAERGKQTKKAQGTKTNKNNDIKDDASEVKYSIRKEFYTEFDEWVANGKKETNVRFVIGNTSDALKSIGVKNQEIKLNSGTVIQKLNIHKEMTTEIFKKIPDLLERPIIVQFSDAVDKNTQKPKYESRITVLGELYAEVYEDGKVQQKPVLVSLELLPTNQKGTVVLDFSIITSAYAKNALQNYLYENSILYIDPNKKRTDKWLSLNRLQLPLGETKYGPIRSITYAGDKVKIQNSINKSSMQTALENAGIVDEYGNPNFSLKNVSDLSSKDRKELLDTIEQLKNEFEITKFAKADPKKLAKMTRDILKEYSSKAEHADTYKAIDELYVYMANGEGGHPAVWDDVYNRAYTIANDILENAIVLDNSQYLEYKSLRDYLRNTGIKFDPAHDEVPYYDSFNEFRRANFGRLKFTNDGVPIDVMYQELSNLYPEFFDAEEYVSSADQLAQIVDVLDSLRPMEVNPFSNEMTEASSYLANDIIERFFELPQAKPTFADKAERRVTEARIRGHKEAERVRIQKDAKIEKLIERQREKTKAIIDKARASKEKAIKKEQDKRRNAISKMGEKQKAKVLRAQILRHTNELSRKLLRPTDNQHIPAELQGAVAVLLESINLESNYTYDAETHSYKKSDDGLPTRRTKAFEELRRLYESMAATLAVDPDLLGPDGMLSDVITLADKRIADMTSAELETVWQTLRSIEASISTANRMFSAGRFTTISDVAESLRADNSGKASKSEFKYVGGLQKLATLDMLTPETYMHSLGNSGDAMFRMMRDAQDKHIRIMKEVSDFTHEELDKVKVNSLEKTIHTVKLGGEDVKLTTAQLMELYVLMKREQAVEHILVGGILPDVIDTKGIKKISKAEPIRGVSAAEITEALSNLTDEEKAIADKLQKFVSTTLSRYGNEASMQVYNYEKFNEKNYWTIRTNKQEVQSDVSKDTAVTTVANRGFTKGTKPHANTSVRIGSIFDTFAAHSSDMATYAAWLGTSEDINRIRNFVFWEDGVRKGTVKGILDTVHGSKGSAYLEKLLADIAIGVKGTDNMNPFDKLTGNYKAAAVGANIRVIIQQPTAILRAMDMIDPQYLAAGGLHPLKGWNKAKKYAPIAQWKDWGYFDINTGRQMKDVLFDNADWIEKTKQAGMWGASMADSVSWGLLWNAVETETRAKNKELVVDSEEYYQAVAKRFTEIVDHTQVVDGILQRSQIMRSNDAITKMATSFMGEPTKQYNMAVAAAYDAKNLKGDARKKAYARLGRTAAALAISGIINVCAQSIVDALRDDDKEKDYWEKWLAAFGENIKDIANPLGYVPFAKDIVSIFQGYDVKRMDTEAITKTFNAAKNMYKAITGDGKYTVAEASAALFAEVARLFGIPVANLKRDIKSFATSFAIGTDNYLMQYRMEKAMLNINYAGNSKNFMDILYGAYNNDKEAYEFIYNDLVGIYKEEILKQGVELTDDDKKKGRTAAVIAQEEAEKKIRSAMETRMKNAEGVNKVSDLTKRFMTPDIEDKYDSSLSKVKASRVWESASAEQRKNAEDDLYSFLTATSESMEKAREEAREMGIDETEYTLWQLAKEMVNDEKTAISTKERAAAMQLLDLPSDTEWNLYLFKNESKGAAYVYENGIESDTYADFIEALNKADKPTKSGNYGSYTQAEATEAINNLEGLTREEKAILWQSVNSSWKKNPFR